MNAHDLRQALRDALATGRIGTPVSVRLYLHQAEGDAAPFNAAQKLLATVIPASPSSLQATRDTAGRQTTLLLAWNSGETAMLTLVSTETPWNLQLVVVGNHGIIQLEGESPLEPESGDSRDDFVPMDWSEKIEDSLRHQSAVALAPPK